MLVYVVQMLLFFVTLSGGQLINTGVNPALPKLHSIFAERLGNFTIELLYKTGKSLPDGANLVMSPLTVWTVLSVLTEAANGETLRQLETALRRGDAEETRNAFKNITEWLQVSTNTIELAKLNAIFVDKEKQPEFDFRTLAKRYYDTDVISLNFTLGSSKLAESINSGISKFSHGKIDKIIDPAYFNDGEMVVVSGLYFKGQWTVPFNKSLTAKAPFYDSNGKQIGEVNMMYNRYNYPFANMKKLKARVIEVPYGNQDRLSMLILLPYPNVSLASTIKNFENEPLDNIFTELRVAREDYSDEEVDCFIPRFEIESKVDLSDILRTEFGIYDLFNEARAKLPKLARNLLYVTRVMNYGKIEVTEEGTEAASVTVAELTNRIGVGQFIANRPFSFVIVEKVTNSIVYGGIYQNPSLY